MERVRADSQHTLGMGDQKTTTENRVHPDRKSERRKMSETRRLNSAPYVDSPCIHQLIERQVILRPRAIALVHEEQTMTYAEVNARANRIAHRLIELGVLPDDRVALCVSRSPAMIIGMLAILKAGGAYAPIDPVYSSARSERILGDVCPKILLSDKIGRATLNEDTIDALTVIDPNILPDRPTCNPRVPQLNSKHLSHVTYTSGSTGLPKGVMVEHRNIVRALSGCELWFNFDPNDTWSLLQSISSGFGLWTLWGSLGCGAQMVIVSHEISRSPLELHRLVRDKKITILSLTPSVLRLYIAQYCREPRADNLRYIVIAGERFNTEMLRSWFNLRDDVSPRVVNCYGATEMTLFPAAKLLEKGDADSRISPVGRPSFDSTIYLLDDDCSPVPNGEAGEICVDAGGIARGYLNRDDLTSKRFLANPFSEAFDGRMYRSGDIAYHRADGTLAFVGRNDEQFKIRGFRIEPCEVETCLIAHPAVRQAHVLVVSSEYLDRLVAYVVVEVVDDLQVTLYEHASAQLPQYMVPSAFVVLDEFPLNQSGKIDCSALPEPDETTFPRRAFEEPQGVIEKELAKVWGNLLGLDRVGRWDSFFAIGGHSLIVAHVIEHMRSLGWNLTISNLFQYPVLFELATTVTRYESSHRPPPPAIVPNLTLPAPESLTLIDLSETDIVRIIEKVPGGIDNIQDIYGLSPLQDGILFHYLLNTEADPYVIRTVIEFADKHILESYLTAFQRMIDRHDILRTSFVWDGISVPAQVVWRRAELSVTETSLDVDTDHINGNPIRWFDSRDLRINLEQAPLVRFVITRTNSGGWIMLQMMHHLIGDEITIKMMHIEMQAHLSGQKDLLQPSPYRNLISKMRLTVDHEACAQFFTEILSDVDASTLPFGLREVYANELETAQSQLTFDPGLMQRLRLAARNFNVSLATLCHVTWAVIISRACDQNRVVFGTVLLGRMQTGGEVESAMGLYVNTLPLRLDIDDTPVAKILHRTHLTLARLLEHEYASLALIQRCSSIVGGAPLFSSLLNVRNSLSAVDLDRYPNGMKVHGTLGYTSYPLGLTVEYGDSKVVLVSQVAQPICSKRVCSYMQRALKSLDEALHRTPRIPVRCLEILPQTEKRLLLETWNDTVELEPNDNVCIHRIFEEQARIAPDAIALVFEEHKITYRELNVRANRIARELVKLGITAQERVAFCLDRTPEMVACILAVLKAGGAYVPIDPAYTCERVSHMLNDAEPKIILADVTGRNALENIDVSQSIVLDPSSMRNSLDANPITPEYNSRCLAYIIYTSGSTGKPKGVMIEHRNIVRLFRTTKDVFRFKSTDVWCLNSSIAFDMSMLEVWGALYNGSRLVVVPRQVSRSTPELERLICQHRVTIWYATPSAFAASVDIFLNSGTPNELRYVIVGAEKLEPSILKSWYAVFDETAPQLVNMFGTTETTIVSTCKFLTKRDADSTVSPVGRGLPDTKLYLLDACGQPVPLGAVGEIYLGGSGTGRGYRNLPTLTNERFVSDPFSSAFDARMYRTGDTGYYLGDGSLVYSSRNDDQVKIRGFRIELGEVEACILKHAAVSQVCVLIVSDNRLERLVAYVVAKSTGNIAISLREHVSERLPEYMVPSAFVVLDEFPLTRNGKLDRRALPKLDQTVFAHREYEEPQGPIEIELANIWRQLLGLDRVGRHDSFFTLGGHSLLAVRVSEHLRTFGWSLSARDLFDYPVLSELAATVGKYRDHVVPPNVITPYTKTLTPDMLPLINLTQSDIDRIVDKVPGGVGNIQDIYALSPLQDGILFHHLLTPDNDPYYFVSQLAFTDRNLLDRYLAGIQSVVDRHDILRTSLLSDGLTRPAQVVWREAKISVVEITDVAGADPASELTFSDLKAGWYRIDLETAPMLGHVIAREASGRWILNEILHHLIIDNTSYGIFQDEVRHHMSGRQDSLAAPIPFRNFISKIISGDDQRSHERFFREMLRDVHEPTLPYGVAEVYNDGSGVMESRRMLSSKDNNALRDRAKRCGVSLASLFHLAFGVTISRTTCQNQVVFGTVFHGRTKGSTDDGSAIGLFVNTLPVRIDIDATTVQESLKRTHKLLAELLDYEHASLVLAQRCSSVGVNGPLFSALLNYRHITPYMGFGDTIEGMEVMRFGGRTNYPLVLSIEDYQSALGINAQTVSPITPERLLGYVQRTLESLTDALGRFGGEMLCSIEMMPETERKDLFETRNLTERSWPDAPCIHHIFEQHARRTPKATAIVDAKRELTYAELNDRANQLAHHLIKLGVSKGERLALCVERSPAMIIGIIAILKAGAAYVPVDPAHPSHRLSYILNDSTPTIALVDDVGSAALGNEALTELKVIDPNALFESRNSNLVSIPNGNAVSIPNANPVAVFNANPVPNLNANHLPALHSENLAYVIYTSGTTGKPKGVMVRHRNVVELLGASGVHLMFDQRDTWCLFHSIAFDFSVWELWGALCHGGKLVIVPRDVSRSPEDLRELVWEQGVTVMNFTPNAFREFANIYVSDPTQEKLRYIIFGGEKLDYSILKSWYGTRPGTNTQLVNMYGITETTVHATYRMLNQRDMNEKNSVIGVRFAHNKIYVLDSERRPVPVGVVGEIYIGGAGVTSGYLNGGNLTNERFLSDPFSSAFDARIYRTGDLARYIENGELTYMGRNDKQVKIRGFRVGLVEIEDCLIKHSLVRQALVRVIRIREFDNLVAYVVADAVENLNVELRDHASAHLPEYMVPSAFVRLDRFSLTQNGKIDHSALLIPDEDAFASQTYEEPQSPLEIELAMIWSKLLKVDKIGRQDSFFALGGHSLFAVRLIEQLRARGWKLSIRDLFKHPILYALANSITKLEERRVPPNVIHPDTRVLTPDMLPLIELGQSDIDSIVAKVPGGLANIQDIYALSPLQEGILFHNLLATENDPYLVTNFMRFTDRSLLDCYLNAVQRMVDRHDILRTAFFWKTLTVPAQVVWRRASISIIEVSVSIGNESLYEEFRLNCLNRRYRSIDLERAPLLRFIVTRERFGSWLACQQMHHLIGDETTTRSMSIEICAHMSGGMLPITTPYRNLVHTMRTNSSTDASIRLFTEMLHDVDSPTLPYGLYEVHANDDEIISARLTLSQDLVVHLRSGAQKSNVGVATLCHVACALVLSRICDLKSVVFGTVLFGRMHGEHGAGTAMGLYINTLPIRLDVDETPVSISIREAHKRLADLLEHEHASLAIAQRCSSIPSGQTLFSTLLNFRQRQFAENPSYPSGIEFFETVGCTNYPLALSVNDDGHAMCLFVNAVRSVCACRLSAYMNRALESLVDALELEVAKSLNSLEILPCEEQNLTHEGNTTEAQQCDHPCVHHLFEGRVRQIPNAIALVYEEKTMTYEELNVRANRLAHELIELGVEPGTSVGLCVARGTAMVVGILAILKAGGTYVPVDPIYACERLSYILTDANPSIMLVDAVGRIALNTVNFDTFKTLDPNATFPRSKSNPLVLEFNSTNLAYIIYTSGSTGKPKGVIVQHRNIVQLLSASETYFRFDHKDTWCLFHSIAFDFSVWELWGALSKGAKLIIISQDTARSTEDFQELVWEQGITVMNTTPNAFRAFTSNYVRDPIREKLRYIIFGGEKLDCSILKSWYVVHSDSSPELVNMYGITEVTVHATYRHLIKQDANKKESIIGKRLPHSKTYVLDSDLRPVPVGAVGEIYIGGAGVASGYLNRIDLTSESFFSDPFSDVFDARMYRTGDLARYIGDSELAYMGRNDKQVKIRGFRIEVVEIENCLVEYPSVRQALVRVISSQEFDNLVAYVTADAVENLNAELREYALAHLPEYMVPFAFVRLDEFPLTHNGKIDHSALPIPDETAFGSHTYEEPRSLLEIELAMIWSNLLKVDNIGRQDSFFALGGHSLLAVRLIEQLRARGWKLSVRDLFKNPTLYALANSITKHEERRVPPNVMDADTRILTPDMLPLIEISQSDIDSIVAKVPGELANIQDIYALSPLQEGILFHNLLATEDDPYLVTNFMRFTDRSLLDCYLNAVQRMVDRHDIFRTAFFWKTLTVPAQVVWRRASISSTEVSVSIENESLYDEFRSNCLNQRYRSIDLERAPLLRFIVTRERSGSWLACQQMHHLIGDETTNRSMSYEICAHMSGGMLPITTPYRNLVHTMRTNSSTDASIRLFTEMLHDVDSPTLPFGLYEVHANDDEIISARLTLSQDLVVHLRSGAQKSNVGVATLCHVACALVLSRICDLKCVVFGTVLFGRMHGEHGAGTAMGLYINTLPIRLDVDKTPVSISIREAHKRLADLLEHEHASLAIAQRCSSIPSGQTLFSTLLNFRQQQFAENPSYPSGIKFLEAVGYTNYPLVISVIDDGHAMCQYVDAVRSVCARRLAAYMNRALESLVDALELEAATSLSSLEVAACEEHSLIHEWNTTEAQQCDHPCVHQLFEQQVRQKPNAIALVYEQETMTYAELNVRANRLAHELIDLDVRPGSLVGLCVARGTAMVVGILAILKAGGTYVPVDPIYACERLSYILTDANPSIMLVDAVGRIALDVVNCDTFKTLDPNATFSRSKSNPLVQKCDSTNSAYIIYTSGSTGKPKGVIVQHRNITQLLSSSEAHFRFSREDTWCLFHSIAFDFSVWELWGALSKGAKLIIVLQDTSRSPRDFQKLVWEQGITVMNTTPNAFRAFTSNYLHDPIREKLRYIIFGGEKLDCSILKSWYAVHSDSSPELVNMYGITEITVHATYRHLTKQDANEKESIIGKRLAHSKTYVLDSDYRPVPMGAVGEIYIGGAGVASGYLNRIDLTSERFFSDPFSDVFDARMYRTGDLARHIGDSELAYMGRNDKQVKIRGFRIEVVEIENCLVEYPSVRQALVRVISSQEFDNLVAYVTADAVENLNAELREYALAHLPEYMVPFAFVRLDEFPLTHNGKIDYSALPIPNETAFASRTYEKPCSLLEIELAMIWSDLLKVDKIGRYDSFFALGGHSLLAVRLIEQLSVRGWALKVRDLFNHPVLSQLAETITRDQERNVPPNIIELNTTILTPDMLPLIELTQSDIDIIVSKVPGGVANIQDVYALSPLQEGILFHNLLAGENDPYLSISFMEFDDRNRLDRYLDAVQCMVNRHDILRSSFVSGTVSVPAQVVWRHASLAITEVCVSSDDDSVYDKFKVHCFARRRCGIDLETAPLLCYEITRGNSGRWLACQFSHHLIGDATTLQAMYVEMQAYMSGGNLPHVTPYRNLVHFIRNRSNEEATSRFFTEMLSIIDSPTLPFGLDNVYADHEGSVTFEQQLAKDLTIRLRAKTRDLNVAVATLCHVAWALVLSRICDQTRVVFGTVLFGRMHTGRGSDTAMGLYINTLPFRVDVDNTPVEIAVRRVHRDLADLLEHENASLALAQRCSSVPSGLPLFSSLLNFRQQRLNWDSSFATGINFLETVGNSNFPLNISIDDDGNDLYLSLDAVQHVNLKRLSAHIREAIEGLVDVDTKLPIPLRSIEILPEEERELMVGIWNVAEVQPPDPPCMHELFELHVLRAPEAIALVFEDEIMSYAKLNKRANQLAHELISLGVSPGTLVGLCIKRTPAMIAGVLAILKAGCAYVPVDPAYTCERLSHILDDANPRFVLADERGRKSLRSTDSERFTIIDPNIRSNLPESNPLIPELCSTYPAYVIYTSGTTGKPKGVMIQHQNIVCAISATDLWFQFNADDTWCLYHSIAFDASVWELWGSLSKGAKLIILSQEVSRSPQDMWEIMRQQKATILSVTPSAFGLMKNYASSQNALRYIMLSGEKVQYNTLQWWYSTRQDNSPQLVNIYGPTETTVYATYRPMTKQDVELRISPIGKKLSDKKIYLLDSFGQPVPLGATGEVCIGGTGVACGYLNEYDLTNRHFVLDPFSDAFDAKIYRTGDLAHQLEDGELVYKGRKDQQIQIRGFRIEPFEIETCLASHPKVYQALVRVISDGEFDRLIAYVRAEISDDLTTELNEYATAKLPEYMVPSAFMILDAFPLTQHGKIDFSALPSVSRKDFASRAYEEPQGKVEIELAEIWSQMLDIDKVGRYDSFFALGGHSLLAVRLIEQLSVRGWALKVRDLFNHPVLSQLAETITRDQERNVPPNIIELNTTILTPDMLPLIELTQSDIDIIVSKVPGGIANIQDIYALSPLQEGILFHNLLAGENDPYLSISFMEFDDRYRLDRYLDAVQCMVNRHDILRTSFIWETVSVPAQVVWRQASLTITDVCVSFDDDLIYDEFKVHCFARRRCGIDLEIAPLSHFEITRRNSGRWLACQFSHHLIGDATTLQAMYVEMQAHLNGGNLPNVTPYRNLVHIIRTRSNEDATSRFFTEMLSTIENSTSPFGLDNVYANHEGFATFEQQLAKDLTIRLRAKTRDLNIAVATLCHVAWALVLSRICDQTRVVFGTVLFGRMHTGRGSDTAMGLYINTLPFRVDVDNTPVEIAVRRVHRDLADLLEHENASLALAQRCSSVPSGQPLFSSLLNFRQQRLIWDSSFATGINFLETVGNSNFPLNISIDDDGNDLYLTLDAVQQVNLKRLSAYVREAIERLVDVQTKLAIPLQSIEILPEEERELIVGIWNTAEVQLSDPPCIHELFEQQVLQTPHAIALMYGNGTISYAELNRRANRLVRELIHSGISPGNLVGLCVGRTPAMIVGLLAILKAGAAYVPVDPAYACERLSYILDDANPRFVLADEQGRKSLRTTNSERFTIIDPNIESKLPEGNPLIPELCSTHLAYVIYTSGTTGKPKGVMIQHQNIVRAISATDPWFRFDADDTWCLYHSIAFDASVWEIWGSLSKGAKLIILSQEVYRSPQDMWKIVREQTATILNLTPSAFSLMKNYATSQNSLRYIMLTGEKVQYNMLQWWYSTREDNLPLLVNVYGPTETTVYATFRPMTNQDIELKISPIGKKLSDKRIYLLDPLGQPVPLGATGEVCIGGTGVACGYLNEYDLTNKHFLPDSLSDAFDAKMYRTGDLAYQLEDGELVYKGRKDQQIKIRGFRIEPFEIETCLISHPEVYQALVRVISDGEFDRLIAYVRAEISDNLTKELSEYATAKLPDYMVPSAFMILDEFPLTQNGKVDFSKLPFVKQAALASRAYEEPQGEVEIKLAEIWCQILDVGRVGRYDSFFALGGHSLLAVRLIEQLSVCGCKLNVRDLFKHPVLSQLASTITQDQGRTVPPNIIDSNTTMLTPDMLPLIELTQSDIGIIISKVPGGIANIQDVYALSPLQEGILFHNLLAKENDPYLNNNFMEFDHRSRLDRYLDAVQCMVNRHDILRTSFICETVSVPAQVVWRHASLSITEVCVSSDDDSIYDEFKVHCFERRRCGIDLQTAPLLRFEITRGNSGRWLACQFSHHLIGDAMTLQAMFVELQAHLTGENLPDVTPYRNLVHSMRMESREQAISRFFTGMLREIESPTLPFGLNEVYINHVQTCISEQQLAEDLTIRLRAQSQSLNITVATLFHIAWAMVLSRICDQR